MCYPLYMSELVFSTVSYLKTKKRKRLSSAADMRVSSGVAGPGASNDNART
jgi:hypothetical protein